MNREGMAVFHRILSGQSLTPRQIHAAGIFVLIWFGMDVIQFADMVRGWFH
jgi:hypothetical protein